MYSACTIINIMVIFVYWIGNRREMEHLLDSLDDHSDDDDDDDEQDKEDDDMRSPSIPVVAPPPAKKPRAKRTAKATKKKVHACTCRSMMNLENFILENFTYG